MKKPVKITLSIILAVAVLGCGAMSVFSYFQWDKSKSNVKIATANLEDTESDLQAARIKVQTKEAELEKEKNVTFQYNEEDYKVRFSPSENQQSVAAVFCYDTSTGYGSLGSSYPVASSLNGDVQYFITNGHVVAEYKQPGYTTVVRLENRENVEAEVIFFEFDANMDMAILKIKEPVNVRKAVVIRDSDTVKTGEKCTAIGYPDKSSDIDPNMPYDMASQTVTGGVISKTDVVPNSVAYHTFQHDAFISHGNSGGPLFDENGYLIGMNTLIHKNSENVNFAIHSHSIMEILDQQGIPYLTTEDASDIDSLIAGDKKAFEEKQQGIIDALQEEIDEAQNDVESAESEVADYRDRQSKRQDEVDTFRLMMIIFAAAAALCLVGLLIVLFFKGGSGEVDDGLKSYLVCVQGVFAGLQYEVTSQTMTIGRDQRSCTIVFPDETPGISSNHCSIYYDARTKNFVLTDNGSTYGTYLSDGRKLTKGVPETLVPGATFALADKANVFMVERK